MIEAIIENESAFDSKATSSAGARGLMQLMPQTADALGVTDSYDATQNIRGGTRYLRSLLDRFGKVELAVAAYNAGPEAVQKYGGIPPYEETRSYVRNVLASYARRSQVGNVATNAGSQRRWHHRAMMTQQLEVSILAAPLAAIDRRALSQAWYSALHLARPDRRLVPVTRVRPPHRRDAERAGAASRDGSCGPRPAEPRVQHFVQTKPLQVTMQSGADSNFGKSWHRAAEPTDRTPIRTFDFARQTCHVFDGPRRGPSPRDPPNERKRRHTGRALQAANA